MGFIRVWLEASPRIFYLGVPKDGGGRRGQGQAFGGCWEQGFEYSGHLLLRWGDASPSPLHSTPMPAAVRATCTRCAYALVKRDGPALSCDLMRRPCPLLLLFPSLTQPTPSLPSSSHLFLFSIVPVMFTVYCVCSTIKAVQGLPAWYDCFV